METHAWGSWNFELVQILFITWIADCFVRTQRAHCLVFFRDGKLLLEAVGILSLCKYSWSVGLQMVFVGMHSAHCLDFFRDGKLVLEAVRILSLCEYCWSVGLLNVLLATHGSTVCCLMGWIVCTVCFYSWSKIFAWGSWNFEFLRILFTFVTDTFPK